MEINDQRPEWLKSLSEKTWNLELIISGAATYMSSHLPGIIDQAFYFFLDNLNQEQDIKKGVLPLLAYCFAKVVAWVLPASFLVHFIMRAFWAGLVGLHTVFPGGIDYDNLPGYRGVSKEVYRESFGTLADYIYRLDRRCNQMFAFSFTIVLLAFGVSIVYLAIFLVANVLPQYWKDASLPSANAYTNVFVGIFIVVLLSSKTILKYLSREKYPRLVKFFSKMLIGVPNIMLPFVFRPVSYLTMTFSSNISKQRFYLQMTGVGLLVIGAFMLVFMNTIYSVRSNNPYVLQQFFGRYRNEYTFSTNHYNSLLAENRHPAPVTIPEEVVEGPFLKIFVNYPKSWDQTLTQTFVLPEPPDNWSKTRQRTYLDSLRIDGVGKVLKLQINDSVYTRPDWQFSRHPIADIPGIQTIISTQNFKAGKNTISVFFPSAAKPDSMMLVDQVPFWFGK